MGLTYNTSYGAPRISTKTSYVTSPTNQDKDEYEKMIQSQLASGSGAEPQQQTAVSDGTVTTADAPPPPETSTYDDSRYTDGNFIESRDLTVGMEAGVDGLGDFQGAASEEDPMATRVNDGSGAESLLDDPRQAPNLNFIDTGMDGVKETGLSGGSGAESMLGDPATAPDPTAGAGAGGGAGMSGGPGDNAVIDDLVVQRLKDLLGEGPRDTSEAERAANWRATGQMRQHMGRMAAGGFGASGASGRLGGMIEMDRVGAIDDIQRQAQQDYENRVLQGLGVNIGYENLQDRRDRAEMMNTILEQMLGVEPEGDGDGDGDGGSPDPSDPGKYVDDPDLSSAKEAAETGSEVSNDLPPGVLDQVYGWLSGGQVMDAGNLPPGMSAGEAISVGGVEYYVVYDQSGAAVGLASRDIDQGALENTWYKGPAGVATDLVGAGVEYLGKQQG